MYPPDKIAEFIPVPEENLLTPEQVEVVREAMAGKDEYDSPWPERLASLLGFDPFDHFDLHISYLVRNPGGSKKFLKWLENHPVMQPSVAERTPAFFSPLRDLEPKICETLEPGLCSGLAKASRQGREWVHAYSRDYIQKTIRSGNVVYAVASVKGLYGGHPYGDGGPYPQSPATPTLNTPRLMRTGSSMEERSNKDWFRCLNNIPKTFTVFASRTDAIHYADWAGADDPIIVTLVSMRSLPPFQLSQMEICYNGPEASPFVSCSRMNMKDAVILGLERVSFRGWAPASPPGEDKATLFLHATSNVFCSTPFDNPTPTPLRSQQKLRALWHRQFLGSLPKAAAPTLTDLCHWLVGYCSYYLDHKGEKGQQKANDIRKLMQKISQTLNDDASIDEFLHHRPGGEKTPSLYEIINDRRDKKAEKESWGWKQIKSHFLSDSIEDAEPSREPHAARK